MHLFTKIPEKQTAFVFSVSLLETHKQHKYLEIMFILVNFNLQSTWGYDDSVELSGKVFNLYEVLQATLAVCVVDIECCTSDGFLSVIVYI